MKSTPSVVVGVGGAGITLLSIVAEVVQEKDDGEMFAYIAIDTDCQALEDAPSAATKIDFPVEYTLGPSGPPVENYPYLTPDTDVRGDSGRQRSVGRARLDGLGIGYRFGDVIESIYQAIVSHHDELALSLPSNQSYFNVFLVHSFGGGTGSGMFPLFLGALQGCIERLESPAETYFAGVGVVPEVHFDPNVLEPDNPEIYVNAWAGLRDLELFLNLTDDSAENLKLPIYSAIEEDHQLLKQIVGDQNVFVFDDIPFDDYWLVGVNEERVRDKHLTRTGESYRHMIEQSTARSIYGLANPSRGQPEAWKRSDPYTGTFTQTEVSVPHAKVKQFVDLKEERTEKKKRCEEEIPRDVEELEGRKAELESRKRELEIDDEELEDEIEIRIDKEFPSGAHIVESRRAKDIEAVLDEIEEDYEIEGMIVATNVLLEKIKEERGAPAIENEWQDTVQELWSEYRMHTKPKFETVRTLEGKANSLEDFLTGKIKEYRQEQENWNPSTLEQIQDMLPPVVGPFESDREYFERWIEAMQSDYDELENIMGEWGRVSKMVKTIEQKRSDIREEIDVAMNELNREITTLQNERDDLREEIRRVNTEIEKLKDQLIEEQTSERIAVLPIEEDKLDDLDRHVVDRELTSLRAYIQKGFVPEEKARVALNERLGNAEAWDLSIAARDTSGTDQHKNFDPQNDIWYLFHEDNRELFKEYITDRPTGAEEREAGQDKLNYLDDPYRIEYIGYTRRGPISAFEVFQRFEQLEADGHLADMARQHEDYRQAFAYMEWYGKDIQEVFDVKFNIFVKEPPELEVERVNKPELDEGELKNHIVNPGLVTYLWRGNMWESYESGDEVFRGWKRKLSNNGITFTDLQKAQPNADFIHEWLSDQRDWEDILGIYRDNLVEQTETKLIFRERDK